MEEELDLLPPPPKKQLQQVSKANDDLLPPPPKKKDTAQSGESTKPLQQGIEPSAMPTTTDSITGKVTPEGIELKEVEVKPKETGYIESFMQGIADYDDNAKGYEVLQTNDKAKIIDFYNNKISRTQNQDEGAIKNFIRMFGGTAPMMGKVITAGATGGALGSVVPGVGTAVGTASGAVAESIYEGQKLSKATAFEEAYADGKNQGLSDDEAYEKARQVAMVGQIAGGVEGAVSGLAGGTTGKIGTSIIKNIAKEIVSDALVGGTAAAARKGTENIAAQQQGLNRETTSGVVDEMSGEATFSVVVGSILGAPKLIKSRPKAVTAIAATNPQKAFQIIDKQVELGEANVEDAEVLKKEIADTKKAFDATPETMTYEEREALTPKIAERQKLEKELEKADQSVKPFVENKIQLLDKTIAIPLPTKYLDTAGKNTSELKDGQLYITRKGDVRMWDAAQEQFLEAPKTVEVKLGTEVELEPTVTEPTTQPTNEVSPSSIDKGEAAVAETPTVRDVESINSVNPTGTVFVEYTPEQRMKAPLGENMVTLEKTIGGNPDDVITIYRGVPVGVKGEIVGGDYVTTNKQLAKDYAGDGNVIELKVKKSDVIDDKTEPAGEEYIYRPKSESLLSKPQTPTALRDVESTAKALETLNNETPPLQTQKTLTTNGLPNLDIVSSKESSSALESEIGGDIGGIDNKVRTIPIQEYDVTENNRSRQIAEQIEENGWIEPLIVSYDKNGNVYIVEGQHRAAALKQLGYDKAPVIVIYDKSSNIGKAVESLLSKKPKAEVTETVAPKTEQPIAETPTEQFEVAKEPAPVPEITEQDFKTLREEEQAVNQDAEIRELLIKEEAKIRRASEKIQEAMDLKGATAEDISDLKEVIIADNIARVTAQSFKDIDDVSNIEEVRDAYILKDNSKDDTTVDKLAQDISVDTGMEITPADIVAFMRKYPNGRGSYNTKKEGTFYGGANPKLKQSELLADAESILGYELDAEGMERFEKQSEALRESIAQIESQPISEADVDALNKEYEEYLNTLSDGQRKRELAKERIEGEKVVEGAEDANLKAIERANAEAERKASGAESIKEITESLDDRIAKKLEELKKRRDGKLYSGFDFENLDLYTELAYLYIRKGIKSAADFAKEIGEELSDAIKKAWDAANENYKNEEANFNKWKEYAKKQFAAEDGALEFQEFKQRFNKKFNVAADDVALVEVFSEAQSEYKNEAKKATTSRQEVDKSFKGEKKTVEVNEKTALKDQIKLEVKAARDGFRAARNKQDYFAERIKTVLKDFVSNNTVTTKQAVSLVNRAAKIKTERNLIDFLDYAANIIDDADYDAKLSTARSLQQRIKARSKSKAEFANNKDVLETLGRVPLKKIKDLDKYIEVAEDYFKSTKPVTSAEYKAFSNKEAAEYLQDVQDYLDNKYKEEIEGIYDVEGISADDAKMIEDFFESEDADAFAKNLSNDKAKALRDKLQRVGEYTQMALQDFDTSSFSARAKQFFDGAKGADLSLFDAVELREFVKTVENAMANNTVANMGNVYSLIKAKEGIEKAQQAKGNNLSELNKVDAIFSSMPLLIKKIYGTSIVAAKVRLFSGIEGVFNGGSITNIKVIDTLKKYRDVKVKFGRDSQADNLLRGMYAIMVQNSGGEQSDVAAQFSDWKNKIDQSIDAYSKNERTKELAAKAREVFIKHIEPYNSVDELNASMGGNKNKELVEFWQKEFEKSKDALKENTEAFYNEKFEDQFNYTPVGYNVIDVAQYKDSEGSFQSRNRPSSPKQSPTTLKRTKSKNIPEGWALNLDFDAVMQNKYQVSQYDINTSESKRQFQYFTKNPLSTDVFGGVENKNTVINAFNSSEKQQSGLTQQTDITGKVLATTSGTARGIATTAALGGVSQWVKQYPSVMLASFINLGKDAPLMMKAYSVSKDNPIFNYSTIVERGQRRGGIDRGEANLQQMRTDMADTALREMINKGAEIKSKIGDFWLKSLEVGDVNAAKRSWLAFYMQGLKNEGVDVNSIDWDSEYLNLNEENRKIAQAYAEQRVKELQVVSNAAELSDLGRVGGNTYKQVLKDIFLPFSTFSSNMRVRMLQDTKRIFSGNPDIRDEALKGFGGTIAEIAAFQAISIFILGTAVDYGADFLASAFGIDDEKTDEEKKAALMFKFKKWYSSSIKDFVAGGMGSEIENTFVDSINALAYYVYSVAEPNSLLDKKGEIMTVSQFVGSKTAPLFRYKGGEGYDFGLYGTIMNTAKSLKKNVEISLGETSERVEYSKIILKDKEVKYTEEQQDYGKFMVLMDILRIAKMTDADLYRMAAKVRNNMVKKQLYEKKEETPTTEIQEIPKVEQVKKVPKQETWKKQPNQ